MTENELESMRLYASIEPYTNDDNRQFHIDMISAGWRPYIGTVGILHWTNKSGQTTVDNASTREFYKQHGRVPVPF